MILNNKLKSSVAIALATATMASSIILPHPYSQGDIAIKDEIMQVQPTSIDLNYDVEAASTIRLNTDIPEYNGYIPAGEYIFNDEITKFDILRYSNEVLDHTEESCGGGHYGVESNVGVYDNSVFNDTVELSLTTAGACTVGIVSADLTSTETAIFQLKIVNQSTFEESLIQLTGDYWVFDDFILYFRWDDEELVTSELLSGATLTDDDIADLIYFVSYIEFGTDSVGDNIRYNVLVHNDVTLCSFTKNTDVYDCPFIDDLSYAVVIDFPATFSWNNTEYTTTSLNISNRLYYSLCLFENTSEEDLCVGFKGGRHNILSQDLTVYDIESFTISAPIAVDPVVYTWFMQNTHSPEETIVYPYVIPAGVYTATCEYASDLLASIVNYFITCELGLISEAEFAYNFDRILDGYAMVNGSIPFFKISDESVLESVLSDEACDLGLLFDESVAIAQYDIKYTYAEDGEMVESVGFELIESSAFQYGSIELNEPIYFADEYDYEFYNTFLMALTAAAETPTSYSQTVTAQVEPLNATDQKLSWTLTDEDGNAVSSDIMILTVSEDTHSATLTSYAAWDGLFTLTVTSTANPSANATCYVVYAARIEDATSTLDGTNLANVPAFELLSENESTVTFETTDFELGTGYYKSDYTLIGYSMALTDEVKSLMGFNGSYITDERVSGSMTTFATALLTTDAGGTGECVVAYTPFHYINSSLILNGNYVISLLFTKESYTEDELNYLYRMFTCDSYTEYIGLLGEFNLSETSDGYALAQSFFRDDGAGIWDGANVVLTLWYQNQYGIISSVDYRIQLTAEEYCYIEVENVETDSSAIVF